MTDFEELLKDEELNERFRSAFGCIHPKIDATAQFCEIISMLKSSKARCDELHAEIEETKDDNLYYESVFRDITYSMNAVGAIAPFVESIFVHSFEYMSSKQKKENNGHQHPRWSSVNKAAWNCQYVFKNDGKIDRNIAKGIIQLLEALDIKNRFPENTGMILEALFSYRNKMFHGGYEWPEDEREKFWRRVENEWNIKNRKWFQRSSWGEQTWIIYMSDEFIEVCIKFIKESLLAFEDIFRK